MQRTPKLLAVSVLIFIFALGCSVKNNKIVMEDDKSISENVGSSFKVDIRNIKNGKPSREVFLNEGESFKGKAIISNISKVNEEYGLLLLKNYEQVQFKVNGKKRSFYSLKIKSNMSRSFVFEIDNFTKGFYDVDFLIVAKPFNLFKDLHTREISPNLIFTYRANFFVDSSDSPVIDFNPVTNAKNLFNSNIILSKTKVIDVNDDIWFRDKSNGNLDYNLYISNYFEKPLKFAVVAFLNYKQVEINDSKKYYGLLEPQKAVNLVAKLRLKEKKNELFAIFIPKPFTKLGPEPKQELLDEEMVQPSFRIALDKK